MRRKEREITELSDIEAVIRKSLFCRLGLSDDNWPYVVPLCFGYEDRRVYVHGSLEGRKTDILQTIHELAERIHQRALVIVMSDLFTEVPSLLDCFQHMRFRKHDLAVFHMLDRQEVTFEFDRPIRFVDMEDSSALVTDPAVISQGYKEEISQYLQEMKHGCQEFNVDYHPVYTDNDYEKVLGSFLLQRSNQSPQASRR